MTKVVDPDNTDRFEVCLSPEEQTISLRGLGTERHAVDQTGDSDGTTTFTDAGANFTTDGVVQGDILTIISDPAGDGGIIGHYEVQSVGTTTMVVDRAIGASTAADLTYKVNAPAAQDQTTETLADGITWQALHTFLKEEWRTLSAGLGNALDLNGFDSPTESITSEQFELGGGGLNHGAWAFAEGFATASGVPQTRELLRTGGWTEKDANDNILKEFVGVVTTLNGIPATAQAYYQQHAADIDPVNFVLTGPVDQGVCIFKEVTGPDTGTGFAITTNNTITRNDGGNWFADGYRVGGKITIRAAEDAGNNGTFVLTTVDNSVDGTVVVSGTPLTNNAADTTMIAAVNARSFLRLKSRPKGRVYAETDLAGAGITGDMVTRVEKFTLVAGADPAIVLDDGQMAGDPAAAQVPFTGTENHATNTNGATVGNGDGTFDFTSATVSPAFNDGVLAVGDSLQITTGSAGIQGFYEIAAIVDADTIRCFDEPLKGVTPNESTLTFQTRTRVLDTGLANATLADVDGDTGTLTSATATFDADNGLGDRTVSAGDMVEITAGGASVIGIYKVISRDSATQLTLNTSDQIFAGETNQTYRVLRPGMYLQRKSVTATSSAGDHAFNDANPDTITRGSGSFITDGFTPGMAVTVTNADITANNGTRIVDTVAALTMTFIAEESFTADASDTNAVVTGEAGFVRTLNAVDYPFNWRLFGNGGSLAQVAQKIARELRRTTDIDLSNGTARGDISDLLMSFVFPNGTGLNIFVDDLAAADKNNATFEDISGDARNFAFLSGIIITLNPNITDDASAKVTVYFKDPDGTPASGDEYGTNGAIKVKDDLGVDMEDVTPLTSPLNFTFDYTNNNQGGRTPDTDAEIEIVVRGTDKAANARVSGTITKQNSNPFALSAALERNFLNPP